MYTRALQSRTTRARFPPVNLFQPCRSRSTRDTTKHVPLLLPARCKRRRIEDLTSSIAASCFARLDHRQAKGSRSCQESRRVRIRSSVALHTFNLPLRPSRALLLVFWLWCGDALDLFLFAVRRRRRIAPFPYSTPWRGCGRPAARRWRLPNLANRARRLRRTRRHGTAPVWPLGTRPNSSTVCSNSRTLRRPRVGWGVRPPPTHPGGASIPVTSPGRIRGCTALPMTCFPLKCTATAARRRNRSRWSLPPT